MRLLRSSALAMFAVATASWPTAASLGPVVSLQHLLTDKDCQAVPELLGNWTTDGDLSGNWTLQKLGDHNYRLMQQGSPSETSNKWAFDICVAHLDGYLFFDATFQEVLPDGKKTVFGDDDNLFWIPLHLIGRLEVEDDALHFRLLDDDWLQDELKSGRIHLTCSQDDEGQYLLTAPSQELKQFAARFAAEPKAFSHAEDFSRVLPQEVNHQNPHARPKTANHSGAELGRGSFEINRGQTAKEVKFLARGNGYILFLTPQQIVLSLSSSGRHRPEAG